MPCSSSFSRARSYADFIEYEDNIAALMARVLFIFVDGVGLAPRGESNPFRGSAMPYLESPSRWPSMVSETLECGGRSQDVTLAGTRRLTRSRGVATECYRSDGPVDRLQRSRSARPPRHCVPRCASSGAVVERVIVPPTRTSRCVHDVRQCLLQPIRRTVESAESFADQPVCLRSELPGTA